MEIQMLGGTLEYKIGIVFIWHGGADSAMTLTRQVPGLNICFFLSSW